VKWEKQKLTPPGVLPDLANFCSSFLEPEKGPQCTLGGVYLNSNKANWGELSIVTPQLLSQALDPYVA